MEFTIKRGQAVSWDASPNRLAQVDEICRNNVVVIYRRGGQVRRKRIPAWLAHEQQLMFEEFNPFDRACWPPAEKTFTSAKELDHEQRPTGILPPGGPPPRSPQQAARGEDLDRP